jgi:hypothetical protein
VHIKRPAVTGNNQVTIFYGHFDAVLAHPWHFRIKHIAIVGRFNIDEWSREPSRLSRLLPTLSTQLLLVMLFSLLQIFLLGGTHNFPPSVAMF